MAEATKKPGMLQRLGQKAYSGLEYVDKKGSERGISGTKSIVTGVGSTVKGTAQLGVGIASIPLQLTKGAINATSAGIGKNTRLNYASQQIGNAVGALKGEAEKLEKIPSFYKILFLIFFFIFFYRIIYDMGLFFGANAVDMVIYMAWFGIILLFISFIGSRRSRLYN